MDATSESPIVFAEKPANPKFEDFTGRQIGVITVLGFAGHDAYRNGLWWCQCACGNKKMVLRGQLKNSKFKRCSCNNWRGGTQTIEHNTWSSMIQRCTNPSDKGFPHYGGRGITVCERWLNSFDAFCDDMGPRPSGRHSLNRIDNNGNYCPENCEWATPVVQARNTRRNLWVECRGEKKLVQDWADLSGINRTTILMRLKAGWSAEDAIFSPVEIRERKDKSPAKQVQCVIEGCDSVGVVSRGLCHSCYQQARDAIIAGRATWADLERLGLAKPRRNKPRCGAFGKALDAALASGG